MADTTSGELQQAAVKTASAVKSGANTVKNVQEAAAKAASGNYVGAAVSVLKDENMRKIIAIVLVMSFFLTFLIFFVFPLTLYQAAEEMLNTVRQDFKNIGEDYLTGYYDGRGGGVKGFFNGLSAVFRGDNAISKVFHFSNGKTASVVLEERPDGGEFGEEDQPSDVDMRVFGAQEDLVEVYERKIDATIKKVNTRMEEVEKVIKKGAKGSSENDIEGYFRTRFNSEVAPLYEDNELAEAVFDGIDINISRRDISKNQAVTLLSLFSTQINSSIDNIKTSTLLQWLGYGAKKSERKHLVFPMGENSSVVARIDAWTGTFIPQYLVDEASQIETQFEHDEFLKEHGLSESEEESDSSKPKPPESEEDEEREETLKMYQDQFGIAVVDFLVEVQCKSFASIEPTITEEIKQKDIVTYEDQTYRFVYYTGEPRPRIASNGYVVYLPSNYKLQYIPRLGRSMPVRIPTEEAPQGERRVQTVTWQKKTTETVDYTEYHYSYLVPIHITTRPVDDLIDMVGMWRGYTSWEEETYLGKTSEQGG